MSFLEQGTALLLIHAHKGLLTDRGNDAELALNEAAAELARVTALARDNSIMPVFHLTMAYGPPGALGPEHKHRLLQRLSGTRMDFIDGCAPREHELVFTSDKTSGYLTMRNYIQEANWLKKIIIGGFHTSCCVLETTKDLVQHSGLNAFILKDATASVSRQRTQDGLDSLCKIGVEKISSKQFDWFTSAQNGFVFSGRVSGTPPVFVKKQIENGERLVFQAYGPDL